MPPHDPATGLPPIIAAHLGILRRDVDEVKAEQKSQDKKLDLVLDRVAELSGKVSHLSGRLEERRQIARPPMPAVGVRPGSRSLSSARCARPWSGRS